MAGSWLGAVSFGFFGLFLGSMAADRNLSSYTPTVSLVCGALFAIVGAVVGGTADIVIAIRRLKDPR
jgi:hypothetical protein